VPVDRGCNGSKDLLSDVFIQRELLDGSFVIICNAILRGREMKQRSKHDKYRVNNSNDSCNQCSKGLALHFGTNLIKLVSCLFNVVGFNDGRKDREPMLRVECSIKVVAVNASQRDLITRLHRSK
jgi:hypothetical protein